MEVGALLNKLNASRALQLCLSTICNYGHALNCSEIVLEMTHRKFKNWLECSTHSESHISGMERVTFTYCQGRVAAMYQVLRHGYVTKRDCESRSLQRLLLGEEALKIDDKSRPGKNVVSEFYKALKEAIAQPVLREMDLCNNMNSSRDRCCTWEMDRQTLHCMVKVGVKSFCAGCKFTVGSVIQITLRNHDSSKCIQV